MYSIMLKWDAIWGNIGKRIMSKSQKVIVTLCFGFKRAIENISELIRELPEL